MGAHRCGCFRHKKRRSSQESLSSEADDENLADKKWPLWKKILVWSVIVLFVLIFLVFLIIWVVLPVSFALSIAFQRFMIFMPVESPKNPDFNNPDSHGIQGVRNFYISVSDFHNNAAITKIGSWLILPETEKDSFKTEDVSQIIRETKYDVLIYLHGVLANRAKPIAQYEVLRKHFLVISVDHRGYGDSGEDVEMTEIGIVNDHLQIYEWVVKNNFSNNIYYWGHSLGSALSCHTLRLIKEQKKLVPKGLVLESAFTTLAEEIVNNFIGKIFNWLAYFDQTILKPLDNNGFHFYSTTDILEVDCPIMMLHAEDDGIVPSFLGAKLADVAKTKRDISKQGNVTFHLFASKLGYGHNDITKDPNVPKYITDFKKMCESFVRPS